MDWSFAVISVESSAVSNTLSSLIIMNFNTCDVGVLFYLFNEAIWDQDEEITGGCPAVCLCLYIRVEMSVYMARTDFVELGPKP